MAWANSSASRDEATNTRGFTGAHSTSPRKCRERQSERYRQSVASRRPLLPPANDRFCRATRTWPERRPRGQFGSREGSSLASPFARATLENCSARGGGRGKCEAGEIDVRLTDQTFTCKTHSGARRLS